MTSKAFWQQGEVQAGRSLARHQLAEPGWEQRALEPPEVLEVRLRLGFIRADSHGRWQLEVIAPSGGELLALHSVPHFDLSELEETLAYLGQRLGLLLEAYLDPEPFP